jgi:hypothetical protein
VLWTNFVKNQPPKRQTKKATRSVLSELDFGSFNLLLIVHRYVELMLFLAQKLVSRNACKLTGAKYDWHSGYGRPQKSN